MVFGLFKCSANQPYIDHHYVNLVSPIISCVYLHVGNKFFVCMSFFIDVFLSALVIIMIHYCVRIFCEIPTR